MFQRQNAADNPYGATVTGWTDQFECWAWIDFPPPSNETVLGQHLAGQQPVNIKVRYDAVTTNLIREDWRAKFVRNDGITDYFAMTSVPRRLDGNPGFLYLTALRGAPDGGGDYVGIFQLDFSESGNSGYLAFFEEFEAVAAGPAFHFGYSSNSGYLPILEDI
jgi:hypothetical protein